MRNTLKKLTVFPLVLTVALSVLMAVLMATTDTAVAQSKPAQQPAQLQPSPGSGANSEVPGGVDAGFVDVNLPGFDATGAGEALPDDDNNGDAADISDADRADRYVFDPARPVLEEPVIIPVSDGVRVSVAPPRGATLTKQEPFDVPELADVTDAKGLFRYTWQRVSTRRSAPPTQLAVACATAPASIWLPEMQVAVFERLAQYVRNDIGEAASIEAFSAEQPKHDPPLWVQTFRLSGQAEVKRKEGAMRVIEAMSDEPRQSVHGVGRSFLGFLTSPDRVLVCSVSCMERSERMRPVCASAVASFTLEGNFGEEPSSSVTSRIWNGFKQHPLAIVGVVAGAMVCFAGLLVALRGLVMRVGKPRRTH